MGQKWYYPQRLVLQTKYQIEFNIHLLVSEMKSGKTFGLQMMQ